MKPLLRVLAVTATVCALIVVVTLTGLFIKSVWFGDSKGKPHVAVLDIKGLIISATQFVKDIEEEVKNPSVKAIIVRINSPGGLVAPSQEMYEAIKRADQKTPVLISMGSLAASGGYYAALGGRKIYANPGTLTASIGVIMEFANTEKLYQWAKMERFTIKAGKFKDAGTPFRPMKPEERELLQELVLDIHRQFKTEVKNRRKLNDEELEQWADGRVVSGTQALAAKLVDQLGGFDDTVKEARVLAKLPEDAPVRFPEENTGALKKFLFGDADVTLPPIFETAGLRPGWKVLLLSPAR